MFLYKFGNYENWRVPTLSTSKKKNKNLQMWGNISCLRYYFSLPQWKESAGSGTTDR